MESQGSLGHLGSLAGGPVDYRQIRDLLKVQRNAPTDAANTPPPPITSQGHIFRQPPGRRRPYHPDVWGSVEHPYNASPEGQWELHLHLPLSSLPLPSPLPLPFLDGTFLTLVIRSGMATLLKTGGMPINPDGEYGQEVSDPPEPPVVMRRTRFFASIRTALLELREHVDGCVAEYVEQPGEDTGVGELTSKLSGLTQEEQAELAAEEAERKERLRAGIESAFENALGDLGKIVYQVDGGWAHGPPCHRALPRH